MDNPATLYACPMPGDGTNPYPPIGIPPYPDYPTITHIPEQEDERSRHPKPEWKFCPHCGKELI